MVGETTHLERGRDLPALTGVRAVAALGVFASHIVWILPEHRGAASGSLQVEQVLEWGRHGVTLFFVLSGFILTWTAGPSVATGRFLRKRFARVWPNHAVVWLAFVVLGAVGVTTALPDLPAMVTSLLLVQTWVPGQGWANAVNGVAWTLSCEAFFYLAFPFLLPVLRRGDDRQAAALGVAALGGGTLLNVVYLAPQGIEVSTFPPFRIWEFVIGMVLGELFRRGAVRRTFPVAGPLLLLVVALAAADVVDSLSGIATPAVAVAVTSILARLVADDLAGTRRGRGLRSSWAGHAGQISYAFYLVQILPLEVMKWVAGSDPSGALERLGWGLVWFAVTVAAAEGLHRFVEQPALRSITGSRGAGRPVPSAL